MVDYESMSRDELLEAIRARDAKPGQAQSKPETAGFDGGFAQPEFEREWFFERSPYPMLMHDRETLRFLKANDAALRLYGYSREEFLGMTRSDIRAGGPIMPPTERQRQPTGYMHYRGLRTHRKKSGERFEVEVFVQDIVYRSRHARVTLIVDVTERQLAERKLAESEAKYRDLVESSHDLIWSTDADGRITFINQAVKQIYGYEPEEMLGRRVADLLDPSGTGKSYAFFRDMLRSNRTLPDYECRLLRKDGTPVVLSSNATVQRDDRGRIVGVTGISKDVTQQRRAEQALRESEERFRLLAENFRDVFWIATGGLDKVLYVSPAYREIWGMSLDDIYRDPLAWQRVIHSEDLPLVRETLDRVRRGEDTAVEYRIVRPDGDVRWIWDRSYSMTTSDGTRLPCGIAEDITDRKRTESERLAREVAQRETLVKEVHHRIKNHLQGIAGLLRQKVKGNPAFAPLVESAVAELQSVAAAFGLRANLESGSAELKPMLEAIIASVQGVIGGRVSLAYGIRERERLFVAESEQVPLALALNELVFNALKHSSEGGGKNARISVSMRAGACRIIVTNKGKLARGFSFSRGRGIGSGLGLVRSLLPPKDATLVISRDGERVTAVLTLKHPVIVAGEPASPHHHDEAPPLFAAMR